MVYRSRVFFALLIFVCIFCAQSAWAQTGDYSEMPAIKVALSDDQSIVIERLLYTALRRSGYQMVSKATGMRTAVADVNYGDAAILPVQTDGWDKMYPNLIKVPVVIDNVEFTVYTSSDNDSHFSQWSDLAGLRVGFRWQNEYIVNNIWRAAAGQQIRVNDLDELWAALNDGEADAIILPRMSHFEYRYPQGIKNAGVIEQQPVYTYVNSMYDYMVPILEEAYLEIIADGTMELIRNGQNLNKKKPVVLHINSYNAQNEWERGQMEFIRESLESKTALEYYSSYLNTNEFHSQAGFNAIVAEMIRTEFVMRYPDLIIASGNDALEFVLNNYYLLFPNIPVLFFGVYMFDDSMLYGLEEHVTGVFESISFNETVLEMLRLYPQTRRIYILNGHYLSRSIGLRGAIKEIIQSGESIINNFPVEFVFSEDKPLPDILNDIRGFGSDTLVLIGNFLSDSDNTFYTEHEIQELVSQASANPVFCLTTSYIVHGTLGGLVSSTGKKNQVVASMAAEILNGTSPENIPIIYDSAFLNQWQFDHKVLKKYNVNTKYLPAGHVLINRNLPIWESNPDELWLILTVMALFLLVIIGFAIFSIRNSVMRQKIDRQKVLLLSVNNVSSVLLEPNMTNFDDILENAMNIMAEAVGVDRICIWRRNDDAANLCFSLNYQWENGDFKSPGKISSLTPDLNFTQDSIWTESLTKGNCLNSFVRDMNPAEQAALTPRNILSILAVPVFIHDYFWGIVGFDHCKKEKAFDDTEALILRSASRMIVNAVIRNEMTLNLHNTALQLETAANDANNANRAKSNFLANMSHEIRTPMNAILGIAEIQLHNKNLSPETDEAIRNIYDAGDLLLNIINEILDLSRIEAGKMELIPVKYDIPSLINDSVQLNRLRYDSKPIEFNINVDENTPYDLFGDELRIKQVLNNILSNAFKYTEEGMITLDIFSEPTDDSEYVTLVFRVRDTGQGMTQEQVSGLFEEYPRFNVEANRETIGTGLGMSIAKHLLDLMNGKITVKSSLNKGSEFAVYIPQKRIGTDICGKEIASNLMNFNFRSTTLTNKTQFLREYMPYGSVLVVDDVKSNIYVTRGMLMSYGLKIDTASSGFEALDKIKDGYIYDIIFMDHMMPKMDGIETTKKIRETGYTNPVVALTANALIGRAEMFLKNGFNAFISKPIDSRELNYLLNDLIRNKQPPEILEAARRANLKNKNNSDLPPVNSELTSAAVLDIENALTVLEKLLPGIQTDDNGLVLYTTTVHGLKSALANIGETQLSDAALKLEQAGGSNETTIISDETPEFMNALRLFIEKNRKSDADNREKSGNTANENSVDIFPDVSDEEKVFLRDKLNKLKTSCDELNIKNAKTILAELKQNTWPRRISDFINEISLHLLRGECAKVVTAIEGMLIEGMLF